jgi:hypothetical protein
VNSPETIAQKSQPSGVPKTAALLMLMIGAGLAVVAVFANIQRFWHGEVEVVAVRPATSPTPQAQER